MPHRTIPWLLVSTSTGAALSCCWEASELHASAAKTKRARDRACRRSRKTSFTRNGVASVRRVLQVNSAASRESLTRAASRLADVVSNAGYSQASQPPLPTSLTRPDLRRAAKAKFEASASSPRLPLCRLPGRLCLLNYMSQFSLTESRLYTGRVAFAGGGVEGCC